MSREPVPRLAKPPQTINAGMPYAKFKNRCKFEGNLFSHLTAFVWRAAPAAPRIVTDTVKMIER
jgi:hypothetical protein